MCRKRPGREQKAKESLFLVWRVPGAFYIPSMFFKVVAQTSSDRVDLNIPRKILTSYFCTGMDLENPMVRSKLWLLEISGASIGMLSWFS